MTVKEGFKMLKNTEKGYEEKVEYVELPDSLKHIYSLKLTDGTKYINTSFVGGETKTATIEDLIKGSNEYKGGM
jgi:hypothetical protein